jgi:hypothetical protein
VTLLAVFSHSYFFLAFFKKKQYDSVYYCCFTDSTPVNRKMNPRFYIEYTGVKRNDYGNPMELANVANPNSAARVGILSDTHGMIRDEIQDVFSNIDAILHAGDIGGEDVLQTLGEIAPVYYVRGNMDPPFSGTTLPDTKLVQIGGVVFYLLHDIERLDLDPVSAEIDVVVTGHTHRAAVTRKGGVLYVNPGSVGPRRKNLPVSVAVLTVRNRTVEAGIVELDV